MHFGINAFGNGVLTVQILLSKVRGAAPVNDYPSLKWYALKNLENALWDTFEQQTYTRSIR